MPPSGQKPRRASGRRSNPSDLEWLYGFHPVREALRAGRRRIDRLWIREGAARADHEELEELARSSGITVERVDRSTIDQQADVDAQTQGVALRAGAIPQLSLKELTLEASRRSAGRGRRIVVLDGVEDPHNVGALARVAESAGVDGLVLADRRAPGLTPSVSRASAGAIEWLPVARVSNLNRALQNLKESGFWILAADLDGGTPLFEMENRLLTGDLVVILGAEGKGVRPGVLKEADHRLVIPMHGQVASLNVSTAGAVLLYDLLRRSEESPKG